MWGLTDFAECDFGVVRLAIGIRLNAPHVTGCVSMHDGKVVIPRESGIRHSNDHARRYPHRQRTRRGPRTTVALPTPGGEREL